MNNIDQVKTLNQEISWIKYAIDYLKHHKISNHIADYLLDDFYTINTNVTIHNWKSNIAFCISIKYDIRLTKNKNNYNLPEKCWSKIRHLQNEGYKYFKYNIESQTVSVITQKLLMNCFTDFLAC